jgi:hypothetical protein
MGIVSANLSSQSKDLHNAECTRIDQIYLHIGQVAAKLQLLTGQISRSSPFSQGSYLHGGCHQIVDYGAACYDRCRSGIHDVLWGWLKENTEMMQ